MVDLKEWNIRSSLQDYLSIGYLYILVLGIVCDSIYYSFMGVNIISYSTVLDVLLSPIGYLTKNIAFPVMIILLPGIVLLMNTIKARNIKKKIQDIHISSTEKEKLAAEQEKIKGMNWSVLVIMIFSAYMGYAIGNGSKRASKMRAGTLKSNYELIYSDGKQEKVSLIGQNSQYIFYVEKDSTRVTVSPIQGNIKKIRKLPKSKKK